MSDVYKFWAKGEAGDIKVSAEGEVTADNDAQAARLALETMQDRFTDFTQKGTEEGVRITYPSVRKLKR